MRTWPRSRSAQAQALSAQGFCSEVHFQDPALSWMSGEKAGLACAVQEICHGIPAAVLPSSSNPFTLWLQPSRGPPTASSLQGELRLG